MLPKDPSKHEEYKKKLAIACAKPKSPKWHASMKSVFSDSTRNKKISDSKIKLWKKPTYRKKQSEDAQNRWDNPETRKKLIAIMNTPENIEKISKGTKEALAKPEIREKLINKIHEFSSTPEFAEKISKISTKMWEDTEFQKKHAESIEKMKKSPNYHEIMSERSTKAQSKPEYKIKRSKISKKMWENPEFYIKHCNFWYGSVEYETYCELFDEEFKERCRAYFGYCDPLSGTPQNGTRLPVHHVLWNKKTCCDKSKKYFLPLERSTHMRVAGNKTKTRKDWMDELSAMIEGYYEGKSFWTKEEWAIMKDAPHIPPETRYITTCNF